MSSFDSSPHPTKKRRTLRTYGSQNVSSRAFSAVKTAVPGTPLSFALGAREDYVHHVEGVNGHPSTSELPTLDHDFDTITAIDDTSSTVTGLIAPGSDDESIRKDDPVSSQRETRASKRAHQNNKNNNNNNNTAVSKPRKRNNYINGLRAQDRSEPSTSGRVVNRPVSTISKNMGQSERSRDEPQGIVDNGSDAAQRVSTPISDVNRRTPRARSSGRLRQKPPGFQAHNEKSSILGSTPTTSNSSKAGKLSADTPSRQRGRPRKDPISSPKLSEQEENDVGFRKISTNDRPSSRTELESHKNKYNPSTIHSLTDFQAGVRTRQQQNNHTESHASPKKTRHIRNGHKAPEALIFNSHSDELNVRLAEERDVFDIPAGPQILNKKHFENSQKSTTKLQKLLKTCSAQSLTLFKAGLLGGLTGKRSHLIHLEEERRKLNQLITQTVLAGEGNSMILIGPRGCGKSTLVECVVSDVVREHNEHFFVIRLSGFIHTDDKLALREIWRQLGREGAAEEESTGVRTNYADTLTSLLALVTHSWEEVENQNKIAQSIVFVIDEFDLFASHPRQTLLYNLFEVAQSRNAPIAVLGLTTRIDIVESLEKRVKSRFGQRYIHFTHPKNYSSFRDTCKSALVSHEAADRGFAELLESDKAEVRQLRRRWNEHVDMLFTHDIQLDRFLRRLFAHNKCVAFFKSSLLLPISLMGPSNVLAGERLVESSILPPDCKLQLLPSLSDLELSLLIAAARLEVILDTNLCNFSMAYDEYADMASRVKLQSSAAGQTAVGGGGGGGGGRIWGKEVSRGAWEKLMDLELILVSSTGSRGSNHINLMCKVDVALEEIGPSVPRMGAAMSRWCKDI
ncbi:MAG: hypothetical protein Q9209_003460 [Squamulea sp. 1 TL-2023]